jgi:predicted acylesterase/phospholipase RssA
VDEAIAKYKALSKDIFTAKLSDTIAKYDHAALERLIKDVIRDSKLSLEREALLAHNSGCKTFVVSEVTGRADEAYRMRTYANPKASEPSPFHATIWQAARATSAAPMFFHPIIINGSEYSDGATIKNNPAELGAFEGWAL